MFFCLVRIGEEKIQGNTKGERENAESNPVHHGGIVDIVVREIVYDIVICCDSYPNGKRQPDKSNAQSDFPSTAGAVLNICLCAWFVQTNCLVVDRVRAVNELS